MLNGVDIFLVLIIALIGLSGWQRGFLCGILDLLRLVGSWIVALFLHRPLSDLLAVLTDWEEIWRLPIALISLVVLTGILIHAAGRSLLRRVPREYHGYRANRLLGVLPGLIGGILIASILSALLFALPLSGAMSEAVEESRIGNDLAGLADGLGGTLGPVLQPAVSATVERLRVVQPGSDETVQLPFKVASTVSVPELEAEMLELVNLERIANGLEPLEADPELTEVARRHSADMFARGYFSHYTPEGKDPFDRMREANVRFRTAGENLALAPTLQIAHTGLMNSPGHRANILSPKFGRLGIGIMKGGRRGLMVSQEFRN